MIPFQLEFTTSGALLAITALGLVLSCYKLMFSKNLLESVVIMSIFSALISVCYLLMDAPDVAMTEVALGACLSTCVLLNIVRSVSEEIGAPSRKKIILASILCFAFIAILSLNALALPYFGQNDAAVQTHISQYYIDNTKHEIAIPSLVAAILASYRGYDTLGETSVILIAGLAVLLIFSRKEKC